MPEFKLGFKALADLIPEVVGQPVENEYHDPESGDGLQRTLMPNGAQGLMVWRKADNFTAFTDGDRTWINGPHGLASRPNEGPLFSWEEPPVPSPIAEHWASPNCWSGRPFGPPLALVIHTTAGEEAGVESWFMSERSQVSAHFLVTLDGRLEQFVELGDRAWHAGILEKGNFWSTIYRGRWDGWTENPNHWTVGIETEDKGDASTIVGDEQYLGTHAACRLAIATYPSIRVLMTHRAVSPRSRPGCPGARWIASGRFTQLASDLGLVAVI